MTLLTAQDKDILTVCLMPGSGIAHDRARDRIARTVGTIGSASDMPRALLQNVALFSHACRMVGYRAPQGFDQKLKAVSLREARRCALVAEQCAEAEEALAPVAGTFTLYRAPMLAARVYPAADLRHTHALRILTDGPDRVGPAGGRLAAAGWTRQRAIGRKVPQGIVLNGNQRVEIELRFRLLPWVARIGDGTPGALLSPDGMFVEVLGAAAAPGSAGNTRWVADLHFLAAADGLDPDRLGDMLIAAGLKSAGLAALGTLRVLQPSEGSPADAMLRAVERALRQRRASPVPETLCRLARLGSAIARRSRRGGGRDRLRGDGTIGD